MGEGRGGGETHRRLGIRTVTDAIDDRETDMATIGFIGLGNMGGPMAENLLKAGHELQVFDLARASVDKAVAAGARAAASIAEAVKGAEAVVTMLPAGPHVRTVF